jgi:hypothetical protein
MLHKEANFYVPVIAVIQGICISAVIPIIEHMQ